LNLYSKMDGLTEILNDVNKGTYYFLYACSYNNAVSVLPAGRER
jgi:hypothetical protein